MTTKFGGIFERLVEPKEAISRALRFAELCGFKIDYYSVGSLLSTTTCKIVGPDRTVAVGWGKGLGFQSVASAIFEAFEHYFHKYENLEGKISSTCIESDNPESGLKHASPDFNLIFGNSRPHLSCVSFEGLKKEWGPIRFPLILTNPAFQPSNTEEIKAIEMTRLYRYRANTGTASGLTVDDAILHGLLEVIERDALSIAFIKTVLSSRPAPVLEIALDSLDTELLTIMDRAVMESGGAITLWNITSDINLPTVLCSLRIKKPIALRFFGLGTSLSPEQAILRSVLEALQGYHVQTLLGIQLQTRLERQIDRMSLYQRCGLDAGYYEFRGGTNRVSFIDAFANHTFEPMNVKTQISFIVELLNKRGYRSYVRSVKEGDVFVAQTIIPQLERLYLIASGISIAPSNRGKTFL